MTKSEWEEITEELFQEIFKKSAVKRTKYSGLKRNINFLKIQKYKNRTYMKKEKIQKRRKKAKF